MPKRHRQNPRLDLVPTREVIPGLEAAEVTLEVTLDQEVEVTAEVIRDPQADLTPDRIQNPEADPTRDQEVEAQSPEEVEVTTAAAIRDREAVAIVVAQVTVEVAAEATVVAEVEVAAMVRQEKVPTPTKRVLHRIPKLEVLPQNLHHQNPHLHHQNGLQQKLPQSQPRLKRRKKHHLW